MIDTPSSATVKTAISKAWELENKPGRSSVNKTVSMIDSHRSQIAESERGSVDHVLGRHKKVKQSIGDSVKLASNVLNLIHGSIVGAGETALGPLSRVIDVVDPHSARSKLPGVRAHNIGRAAGGVGVLGGTYALGKHTGKKEKKANVLGEFLGTAKHTSGGHAINLISPLAIFDKNIPPAAKAGILAGTIGPYAALGTGAYMLGKHNGHEKKAMLPHQPPPEPKVQQEWRGRPPKMKDQTSVMGAMEHASNMLSPANTANATT